MSFKGFILHLLGIHEPQPDFDDMMELAKAITELASDNIELTHRILCLETRVAALEAEAGAVHSEYEGDAYA